MVDYGQDRRHGITFTVASGASVSDSVEFRGLKPRALITPAVLTTNTAIVECWAGYNGSTPIKMVDINDGDPVKAGVSATIPYFIPLATTDKFLGNEVFDGVNTMQLKLFTSNGTTAQAQGAARTFTLICEEM